MFTLTLSLLIPSFLALNLLIPSLSRDEGRRTKGEGGHQNSGKCGTRCWGLPVDSRPVPAYPAQTVAAGAGAVMWS